MDGGGVQSSACNKSRVVASAGHHQNKRKKGEKVELDFLDALVRGIFLE